MISGADVSSSSMFESEWGLCQDGELHEEDRSAEDVEYHVDEGKMT